VERADLVAITALAPDLLEDKDHAGRDAGRSFHLWILRAPGYAAKTSWWARPPWTGGTGQGKYTFTHFIGHQRGGVGGEPRPAGSSGLQRPGPLLRPDYSPPGHLHLRLGCCTRKGTFSHTHLAWCAAPCLGYSK
jgi:hypothetical protein